MVPPPPPELGSCAYVGEQNSKRYPHRLQWPAQEETERRSVERLPRVAQLEGHPDARRVKPYTRSLQTRTNIGRGVPGYAVVQTRAPAALW